MFLAAAFFPKRITGSCEGNFHIIGGVITCMNTSENLSNFNAHGARTLKRTLDLFECNWHFSLSFDDASNKGETVLIMLFRKIHKATRVSTWRKKTQTN